MELDPFDPAFQQHPFPAFARLRAEDPVHYVADLDLHLVTRMDLVREVLTHPDVYVNSGIEAARRTEPPPEVADEVATIRAQGFPYAPALNLNDPPAHTRYRNLINRALTPRALAAIETMVESVAADLVDALRTGVTVDLVDALARPLPIYAIVRILGLDDSRRTDIARWSDAATASLGARPSAQQWVDSERIGLQFQQAMVAELDVRRAEPRGDLLSSLVAAPPDGTAPLSNAELVWLIRELLVAGNETTTRSITQAAFELSRRNEDWELIRTDDSAADAFAEEAIRLSSPVLGLLRRVSRDTVLGDTPLPAGAIVYVGFGAASRDPEMFEDPDEFRPARAHARQHLAFGYGIHACAGAGLARMETRIAIRALAGVVSSLELDSPDDLGYVPSFFLHGLLSLPVTVHRRESDLAAGPTH